MNLDSKKVQGECICWEMNDASNEQLAHDLNRTFLIQNETFLGYELGHLKLVKCI